MVKKYFSILYFFISFSYVVMAVTFGVLSVYGKTKYFNINVVHRNIFILFAVSQVVYFILLYMSGKKDESDPDFADFKKIKNKWKYCTILLGVLLVVAYNIKIFGLSR